MGPGSAHFFGVAAARARPSCSRQEGRQRVCLQGRACACRPARWARWRRCSSSCAPPRWQSRCPASTSARCAPVARPQLLAAEPASAARVPAHPRGGNPGVRHQHRPGAPQSHALSCLQQSRRAPRCTRCTGLAEGAQAGAMVSANAPACLNCIAVQAVCLVSPARTSPRCCSTCRGRVPWTAHGPWKHHMLEQHAGPLEEPSLRQPLTLGPGGSTRSKPHVRAGAQAGRHARLGHAGEGAQEVCLHPGL